jgi:hypothetical protein
MQFRHATCRYRFGHFASIFPIASRSAFPLYVRELAAGIAVIAANIETRELVTEVTRAGAHTDTTCDFTAPRVRPGADSGGADSALEISTRGPCQFYRATLPVRAVICVFSTA